MEHHEGGGDVLLIILVHGNNGSPSDWNHVVSSLESTLCGINGRTTHFYRFSSHAGSKTLVGVEQLGCALVDEIIAYIMENMNGMRGRRIRLYFIAHSLGGLVTRAALPRLLDELGKQQYDAVPWGFCSIVSPHMGVNRAGGGPFKWLWKNAVESVCQNFYNQTGSDLTFHSVETHEHTLEETLLVRLADPQGPFAQGKASLFWIIVE